jgi:hypothetical protein
VTRFVAHASDLIMRVQFQWPGLRWAMILA